MMKASEARRITDESLQGPVIESYLKDIYRRIKEAALQGKFKIVHPFRSPAESRLPYPSPEAQDSIKNVLIREGYGVRDYPDPDPGDPRSSSYTEISW